MASHPIGSKILEVNTDSVSIVIKGKSAVAIPKSIVPDQRISTVEIAGSSIVGIKVCGEEIAPDNGFIGAQKIAVTPLFFEQSDYQISARSEDGLDISIWHENRNIRDRFENIFERNDEISGIVNFGNSVGYSDFEIWSGGSRKLVVRIEVYPTKISYKEDYRNMMAEISDEVYAVAFDFLKKTYQNMRIGDLEYTTPAMFFTMIETIFEGFKKAVNRIIAVPHHKLEVEHVVLPYYKVKKTDRVSEKFILRHPEHVANTGAGIAVARAPAVQKYVTCNTIENQFTRFILQRTIKRLVEFKKRYMLPGEQKVDDAVLASVDTMIESLKRTVSGSFLNNVDDYKATQSMSLVFEMAPGYRELFKYYLILQRGLEINGDVFRMSMKDTAVLYEYWCFIKLVRMIKDRKYQLASPDVIRVDNTGISVTLVKGQRSEVRFKNPRTGELISLSYNPSEYNTQTIPQKPDNVLNLTKNGSEVPYKYVFDAKYRIESKPDSHYPDLNPGPKLDDINTMHRYRDSIVYENPAPSRFTFEKTMFGAYILFPYADEELYTQHRFYRSIDSVNIGGLPFLPGSTKLVEGFLSELIADSEESAFERAPLPRGIESKLAKTDWNTNDVLVGSRRNETQLAHCLENGYYYVPANQVNENNLPIRYVAIYEGDVGIRHYGEVIRTSKVKRSSIPFPTRRNNANEDYYVFVVKKWLQMKEPIRYCEEFIRTAKYTNSFLLEHCSQTYELFNIHSEEQYRLLYELKKAFKEATVTSNDSDPLFMVDKTHSIWAHNGKFEVLNDSGDIMASYEISAFNKRPGTFFRSICECIK